MKAKKVNKGRRCYSSKFKRSVRTTRGKCPECNRSPYKKRFYDFSRGEFTGRNICKKCYFSGNY